MRGGSARERRRIGLKERGPMRAAFVRSLCNSDEFGNAGGEVVRRMRRIASDGCGDLVVRQVPGSNLTVGGSEVACGLR
jgi:hypothetical protein